MASTHDQSSADDLPPAERSVVMPIDRVLAPMRVFAAHKLAGAGLLLLATAIAIAWANSAWAEAYEHLLHLPTSISLGSLTLEKSLHHVINDGLMGIFFFLVGLEIKREILVGELSTPGQAALPAVAALGGMLVPALLYFAINPEPPLRDGWGIPMATDIAFALGVLAIVGDRVPSGLKVLLTALAIVDDIGAVLVIAIFYTDQIATNLLLLGLLGFGVSVLMNILGVRSWQAYLVVGLLVWLAFLQSGVHATIAALLMAFTIPARTRIDGELLMGRLERAVKRLRRVGPPTTSGLNTHAQEDALHDLVVIHDSATAPLQRLEHAIVGLVTFVILPVFALANAGVSFSGIGLGALGEGIALGVAVGLVVGKPVGIVAFSWVAVRLGICRLPQGVAWRHVLGIGLLGGIGFTMALFIGGLAFGSPAELAAAKLGILSASVVAAVAGLVVLRGAGQRAQT
ncbi:Na+/H+ antiporter NhaA [Paraliomyxa miuraensis]|uniref:Na+/H+ antiporter NhaA n=1 Tax=Paraliomyxa miuraensis TaxID=376150 RepID=UPI0022539C64|nr:Na+/H+ antiporter NhaA [Paraliomyxa miuraensis]MCX4241653.1 Na+/H+ antiporter NhaA [Paraliomyxa miuraensis]